MRIRFGIPVVVLALASAVPASAQETAAPGDSGITVNLEALPVPKPRAKPTEDEMHPTRLARPRPKPDPSEITVATTDTPTEAPLISAEPAPSAPAPNPKPGQSEAPAVVSAPPGATAPAKPASADEEMTTPQAVSVNPNELRGSSDQPPAPVVPDKPINPLEGFAVLTRVRFTNGKTELGADAKVALDELAVRLTAKGERVRLAAFSGVPRDAASDARRLSLQRALVVRAYLATKGVPSTTVDVLAFGPPAEGSTDRVDVLVRSS